MVWDILPFLLRIFNSHGCDISVYRYTPDKDADRYDLNGLFEISTAIMPCYNYSANVINSFDKLIELSC